MDNGNDTPTCIPFLEISDENMIPTNSSLINMQSAILTMPVEISTHMHTDAYEC